MPDISKRSIVVYGGTGFIGSNFANYAARRGTRVVACGNTVPPSSTFDSDVEVEHLDSADLSASLGLLRKVKPEAIVFGVSGISPRAGADVDVAAALTELRSLANVIQGAREVGIKQIVFCSSGGTIYGNGTSFHLETDVCAPKSLYGKLKLQAETLITTLCEPLGIRAATIRIGNPYGPGQSPFGLHGVIVVFLYKMLTAEPITIFGSLESAKDYVYIDDVSAAIWASIERQANGTYNVSSGTPTSLRTLVKKLSDVCAVEPKIQYVELGAAEVPTFKLDVSKARRDLQWSAETDMEAGIAVTKQWIDDTYLKKRHGPGVK